MTNTFTWDNGIVVSKKTGIALNTQENIRIMKSEIEKYSYELEDFQLAFVRSLPGVMTDEQFKWLQIYYIEATTDYPEPY